MFPTAPNHDPKTCQFADANHSLTRLIGWNESERKYTCTDPWKPLVPGLTSRSQILCRFTNSDREVDKIRLVTGQELMLMIGFPETNLAYLYEHSHKDTTEFAGAAFSGFSVIPVFTAALYGAGLAGLTGDPDQELSIVSHPEVNTRDVPALDFDVGSGQQSAKPNGKNASKAKAKAKVVTCDDLVGSSCSSHSSMPSLVSDTESE